MLEFYNFSGVDSIPHGDTLIYYENANGVRTYAVSRKGDQLHFIDGYFVWDFIDMYDGNIIGWIPISELNGPVITARQRPPAPPPPPDRKVSDTPPPAPGHHSGRWEDG